MPVRLFLRIISKNKEIYFLKIITLTIAFACSVLVILFTINEFGYDKFHRESDLIFRILQKNISESHSGNRFSNRVPIQVFQTIQSSSKDSIVVSRLKKLEEVTVHTKSQTFTDKRIFYADPSIVDIFSFDIIDGAINGLKGANSVIISASEALNYFGSETVAGQKMILNTFGDTISLSVVAVYKDFPENSHQEFNLFARFDSSAIKALLFDPDDVTIYVKIFYGNKNEYEKKLNRSSRKNELIYFFQPISEIHFGPRIMGENISHGDVYSILILISITGLIFLLALASLANLTMLTLPHRSKELAIKKLAGTSQLKLNLAFVKESIILVSISFVGSMVLLLSFSSYIESKLSINIISLITDGNVNPKTGDYSVFLNSPDQIFGTSFSKSGYFAINAKTSDQLNEIYISPMTSPKLQKITAINDQIKNWSVAKSEVISWKSKDGATIEGILHKPQDYDPSKKYPLLVVIHGGPTGIDYPTPVPTYVYPIVQWLNKGSLVLRVNYRGSAGYGEAFRSLNVKNLGVGDAWDVISGVEYLDSKGLIDKNRMGCMGWSQGGYISAFLTTTTDIFKAISVGAGISDWATYYVNTDIHPFTRQYLKATPWSDPEIYKKTSPITYINQAKTPTLIQHGEFDKRVPIPNAYELLQGLRDHGVKSELIVYKGFGHGITKPKERLAANWHNWQWFNKYIWGEEIELPITETTDNK